MLAASKDQDGHLAKLARTPLDFGLLVRSAALYVDQGPDGAFRKPSSIDFSVPTPALRAVAEQALAAAQERGTSPADIHVHLRRPATVEVAKQARTLAVQTFERTRNLGMKKEKAEQIIFQITGDPKS